jgi:hypothetical protein
MRDRNAARASHAHVVLPQAIKRMIPPYMNQSIIQLKNTFLVSTIAVGRSSLSGHDHHGGDLPPARGPYDGRGDLFLSAVPADIGGQQVEPARALRLAGCGKSRFIGSRFGV